jgi:hypothetical protein
MLGTYLVNWSGQPIPAPEMMVMRRVAVEMRTIHGVKEVEFTHDICAGICTYQKTAIFGAVGGLFFLGDFGSRNNQPHTVNFFIPRYALNMRRTPGMIVGQSMRLVGDKWVSEDYPEDIEDSVAKGAGKLKLTVRIEE